MNWAQLIWSLYGFYTKAFRFYITVLLALSLFNDAAATNSINLTAAGYHLAIFQLEFYLLVLIIYNFRPARFRPAILSTYQEKPASNTQKERFFWMIYLITLVIIFGTPLLFFPGAILSVLKEMDRSNQFIIANVGAWVPALLFFLLSIFKLYADMQRSVDDAKFIVARTLYVLVVTAIASLLLFLILKLCHFKPDIVVMICLAFNAALFCADYKIYLKTRAATNQN